MKAKAYRLKFFAMAALLLMAAAVLKTCLDPIDWREEVQLRSGKSIWVKRTASGTPYGEIGGGGGWRPDKLTLVLPDSSGGKRLPRLETRLFPILLDWDDEKKRWFVIATISTCEDWVDLGRPPLPYAEFHLERNQWVQHPLQPQHVGRDANLFTSISLNEMADQIVQMKNSRLKDGSIAPKFRRVIGTWNTNC